MAPDDVAHVFHVSVGHLIHPENRQTDAVARRLGERFREQITFESKPTNVYEILGSERP